MVEVSTGVRLLAGRGGYCGAMPGGRGGRAARAGFGNGFGSRAGLCQVAPALPPVRMAGWLSDLHQGGIRPTHIKRAVHVAESLRQLGRTAERPCEPQVLGSTASESTTETNCILDAARNSQKKQRQLLGKKRLADGNLFSFLTAHANGRFLYGRHAPPDFTHQALISPALVRESRTANKL